MGLLTGRTAVVTGAGQGIGRAIAERYADEGAAVAVVDIDEQLAKDVVDGITASGGRALPVRCDVSSRDDVRAAATAAVAEFGPVSILVSNAGITRPAMLWKMTPDQWQQVVDVHLTGGFHWLQAVVDDMKAARSGRIIFSTSSAGLIGSIGQINYASAKAGLLGMVRAAALELAPHDVTVNAVAPAAATPMTETVRTDERLKDKMLETFPLKRWADPTEIAGTYLFLASDEAAYMTGQVVSVDGGRSMVR